MFLNKWQIILRITAILAFIAIVAAAAATMLYYSNIHALNTPQGYKGIFI